MIHDARVITAGKGTFTIKCPLLEPDESYVVFGGNGRLWGRGYKIHGRTGKGWLHRAGYSDEAIQADQVGSLRAPSWRIWLGSLAIWVSLLPVTTPKASSGRASTSFWIVFPAKHRAGGCGSAACGSSPQPTGLCAGGTSSRSGWGSDGFPHRWTTRAPPPLKNPPSRPRTGSRRLATCADG